MKKLALVALIIAVSCPLFAKKILLMPPIVKDAGNESKINKEIEKVFKKKYNLVKADDISSKKLDKLRKCGSKVSCWSEEAEGEKFDYAALFLFKGGDDDEVEARIVVIDIKGEDTIADKKKTLAAEDLTAGPLYKKLIKESMEDIASKLEPEESSDEDEEEDTSVKKKKGDDEDKVAKRKRDEEDRKARLEKERRQREEELEAKREEEKRRREEEKQRRIEEEERDREKQERDRERLEEERQRRAREKEEEQERNRSKLEKNAEKLTRARELVLDMCSKGKYNDAIKAIVQVSQVKCECEEDAKVLALKTQLLNFNKIREKILEGINLLNPSLILDNLEAAKALDQEIVPGGTEFSQKIDKLYGIGYFAKAQELEKKDNYVMANENYEKCVQKDPEKTECQQWLDSKDKIVKKLYDKAKVMKSFNPTQAKNLFRSILKLVTAEQEYYKLAEEELKTLEF